MTVGGSGGLRLYCFVVQSSTLELDGMVVVGQMGSIPYNEKDSKMNIATSLEMYNSLLLYTPNDGLHCIYAVIVTAIHKSYDY